jgi:hypothetical protein
MGNCTAADGETDLSIEIERQATTYGYQQPASKCFESPEPLVLCSFSMQDKACFKLN